MQRPLTLALALLGAVTGSSACTIPAGPPLSRNITQGFRVQVQNPAYPIIHNRFMNLWLWGGGDQHLFLSPYGQDTSDLILTNGVIEWVPGGVRAVINGEVRTTMAQLDVSKLWN